MAIYPKAIYRPIDKNYTRKVTLKDMVALHVSASVNGRSLYGWFMSLGVNASSHFHVDINGTVEQYIDTRYISWCTGAANSRSVSIETQGGG